MVTEGASWKNAKTAAEGKTFNGLNGYLATITSAEENAFILSKLPSISWIGANDAATEGTWTWISGPEAGTTIYTGGDTVSGQYTNWNSGEPSNSNHGGLYENYAAFYAVGAEAGKWNDVKETDAFAYIVEYSDGFAGGTVAEQASTSIILTVPVPPVINSNGSGDNASINYAENGSFATGQKVDNRTQWQLGVSAPITPKDLVSINYAHARVSYNDRAPALNDDSIGFWGIGYQHSLSKRTTLYAAYGDINQSDTNQTRASLSSTTPVSGTSANAFERAVAVGIRHDF